MVLAYSEMKMEGDVGGSGTACGSKLSRGRHYSTWCRKPESRGALPRALDGKTERNAQGREQGRGGKRVLRVSKLKMKNKTHYSCNFD